MRKRILATITVILLAVALAQDAPNATLDIRLSIVETRLSRLESDVAGLAVVPSQLTRIQAQLEALTERSSGNSNVLQQLAMTVVVALLTGGIGLMIGRNRTNGGK